MLHSLTSNSDVPDAVWVKIEEFQKKGSSQNFGQAIEGANSLKQVNQDVINACKQALDAEEAEDTQLRNQHGIKFNRPPSTSVNAQYKQSLFDYSSKIEMASATDVQIESKFSTNTQGFALLSKTRQELGAMIPQSPVASQIGNDPAVAAIKEQLNQLEVIRQGKEKVMKDGMAMHDNMNAVEELMKVNAGTLQKGECFESFRAKYLAHFAQNEAFEAQKQGVAQIITQNSPQLNQLLSQVGNDPAKADFFQKINEAIIVQD